jgi:dsRNA-specific ribonuclease
MGIKKLDIDLAAAKRAIAIPDFKSDDLLWLALTDLSTLQLPLVSKLEQQAIEIQYRRLAFLGDRLLDAVLADHLFASSSYLTNENLNTWRENVTCRESLTTLAIKLGLPSFCSSRKKRSRKPPEEEPRVYGEMFEALVAVVYLDGDRNFVKLKEWLCDRFLCDLVLSD